MHDMLCFVAQVVMPPLLHSAQLKPDVHITDLESTSDNEDEDDEVRTNSITLFVVKACKYCRSTVQTAPAYEAPLVR